MVDQRPDKLHRPYQYHLNSDNATILSDIKSICQNTVDRHYLFIFVSICCTLQIKADLENYCFPDLATLTGCRSTQKKERKKKRVVSEEVTVKAPFDRPSPVCPSQFFRNPRVALSYPPRDPRDRPRDARPVKDVRSQPQLGRGGAGVSAVHGVPRAGRHQLLSVLVRVPGKGEGEGRGVWRTDGFDAVEWC